MLKTDVSLAILDIIKMRIKALLVSHAVQAITKTRPHHPAVNFVLMELSSLHQEEHLALAAILYASLATDPIKQTAASAWTMYQTCSMKLE